MSEEEQVPEESQVDFPVTPTDEMYIELYHNYQTAHAVGFSEAQSFDLVKILFRARAETVIFANGRSDEDEDSQ